MNRRHFLTTVAAAACVPANPTIAMESPHVYPSVRTFSFTFDEVALLKECIALSGGKIHKGLSVFLDEMKRRGKDLYAYNLDNFLWDWGEIAEHIKDGTWEAHLESHKNSSVEFIQFTP